MSAAASAHPELYLGLMSGTSLDGIDCALVDLHLDRPALLLADFVPYDSGVRQELLALHTAGGDELDHAERLGNRLALLYAAAARSLLERAGKPPGDVRAIGCHGQTIRHRPEAGYTIQLGNPALLAERTGITVVCDFRSRDIAAGGQGAPLVPAFHAACFADSASHRAILNLGGIANLTDLPPGSRVTGFDTGPGNLLLDHWMRERFGREFDRDGETAARGLVDEPLLARMLADPYFDRPPPKSTGRDRFNATWLAAFDPGGRRAEDVQATLAELTARSVARALEQHCAGTAEIYVCGGGVHNADLLRRLRSATAAGTLASTASLGVDPDWVEAMAFAWLAQRSLRGLPGNVPTVTGASGPRVLGAIYRA